MEEKEGRTRRGGLGEWRSSDKRKRIGARVKRRIGPEERPGGRTRREILGIGRAYCMVVTAAVFHLK